MKKSKADQRKIVARYIKMFEQYSKMTIEELKIEDVKKASNTDKQALHDAIQKVMMEEVKKVRKEQIDKEVETLALTDEAKQETIESGEVSTESSTEETSKTLDNTIQGISQ